VVLDIMLPGMDGLEVLRQLRQDSDVYVLMLTARSDESDKIVGLTVGADDYMTEVADIAVGERPVQVGFSPDGASLYVSLNGENAVGLVDVASRRLTAKARVGNGPVQVYVTSDGATLLVANQGSAEQPGTGVSFIDTKTFKVVDTVETGSGAHGVVIEPSGRYAYVTNLFDNTLAVLDIPARRLVAIAPTGAEPNGVSFVPGPMTPPAASHIDLALPPMEHDTDVNHHD